MSFKIQTLIAPLGFKTFGHDKVGKNAKHTLDELAKMANDDGRCFPSHELLCYQLMVSDNTLRGALDWLEEHGVISIKRRQKGGYRSSNEYLINVQKLTEWHIAEKGHLPKYYENSYPQKLRVSFDSNPQNLSGLPSNSEGSYIENINNQLNNQNIQMAETILVNQEITAWLAASHLQGINLNNAAFIKANDMGICIQDLDDALGYMQANNKGASWTYFAKAVLSRVTDRLSNQTSTNIADQSAKPKKTASTQTESKARMDAGTTLLENNGVDDKALVADFLAFRESKKAGLLTQSALNDWLDAAKANGLAWSIKAIVQWCVSNDRFTFHGKMAAAYAANNGGVKSESQKMEALKAQIKSDIQEREKPKTQEPRKPRPKLIDTLKAALANSKGAVFA